MSDETQCYTVIVKGDIRTHPGNPLTMQLPHGTVWSVGVGDAFKRENALHDAINYAVEKRDVDWLADWSDGDEEAMAELEAWRTRHDD